MRTQKKIVGNNIPEDSVIFTSPAFSSAIIGISNDDKVIYSFSKMVESLVKEFNITHDEAIDFISYNTLRAIPYMGNKAPIIMFDLE